MNDDWASVPLGELVCLEYGKALPEAARDGSGFPVLGSNGIVGYHSSALVPGPGIVVGRKGTAGSVTWVDTDFSPIDTTYWVHLRDERVTMTFAHLLLIAADLPGVCAQTGVPGLNRDRAYALEVLVPPLPVQRRIVDLMSHLDNHLEYLRAERDAGASLLLAHRSEMMKSVGSLQPAGSAFDILMGRQRSPQRASGPNMTPYLRAANIKDGYLDLSDVKEMDFDSTERTRYELRVGDVLVSEGSGSEDAVGAAAQWSAEIAGSVCFQNTLLRFRALEGTTTPAFTYHWCRWAYESGAFKETATGTNILHIGATRAVEMPVRVPSIRQQDEITALLDALEGGVAGLTNEIASLGRLRGVVLSNLLSGLVDVPVDYDALLPEVA